MEYAELIREIQSGRIRPVVFLFGDETYWMDMAIRLLREKTVSPETRDFNEDILYAEETDGEAVIQAASSFPLMAERRLVVVKSIQKFNAEDRKRLLLYAQAPLQSTCLVCTANDVDRRQSFWSEFTRITASAECKILYENQAAAWVEKAVGSRGGRITSEAALALVQQAGVSLWNLSHEVEKLLTFAHGKKQLDLEDVEAVAGFSRKYANWDFTDAVGGKQLARALDILRKLLEEKSSAVGLIMDLHRRVLLLLRIRVLLDAGTSEQALAGILRLRPFFIKLYTLQAKAYSLGELRLANASLLRADVAIKTGLLDPVTAVTLAVYDLVRGTRRRFFAEEGA
jgi:DNA polymerase-3 subunit delta